MAYSDYLRYSNKIYCRTYLKLVSCSIFCIRNHYLLSPILLYNAVKVYLLPKFVNGFMIQLICFHSRYKMIIELHYEIFPLLLIFTSIKFLKDDIL